MVSSSRPFEETQVRVTSLGSELTFMDMSSQADLGVTLWTSLLGEEERKIQGL